MRCPSCNEHNPPTATICSGCQSELTPKRRRRAAAIEDSPKTEEYNRQIQNIFRTCLFSLIPFVGLVLGPIGASRAWRFLQQSRSDPAFQAERPAKIAVTVGLITGVSNWLGVGLMILGWLQL